MSSKVTIVLKNAKSSSEGLATETFHISRAFFGCPNDIFFSEVFDVYQTTEVRFFFSE